MKSPFKKINNFSGMRKDDCCVIFDDDNHRYFIPEGSIQDVEESLLEDLDNCQVPAADFLIKLRCYTEMSKTEAFFFMLETAVRIGVDPDEIF